MASGVPYYRRIEHHIGHFTWSFTTSQTMMSIRLPIVLHAHTTDRPSHFLAPGSVSIDHVRDTRRTGEYALEDRDDAPTAKAHRP